MIMLHYTTRGIFEDVVQVAYNQFDFIKGEIILGGPDVIRQTL